MSQQLRFAFQSDLIRMLNAEKAAWPPHSKLAALLRPWRGTGMKSATYARIRAGGGATRKDISDLIRLHVHHAYQPFSIVVDAFLHRSGSTSHSLSVDALFLAVTVPFETVDYMSTGGAALFELLPRLWANPVDFVAGVSMPHETTHIAEWIRTVEGRQLAGNDTLSMEEAALHFREVWGLRTPDTDRQFSEWSDAIPWTVIYSGFSDRRRSEPFLRTGCSVILPLGETSYHELASGRRFFDDIHVSDFQVPCFGVYIYGTCESPSTHFEDATRNSMTAMMWQIASLTGEGPIRALAPAPIPLSVTRLQKSGFKQVGVCDAGSRQVPLWELHTSWIHRFILDSMRCVLRNDGFMERPPFQ